MKFYVIGITDAPQPYFPPEVLEIIKQGRLIRSGTMEEVKGDASLEDVFLELEAEA